VPNPASTSWAVNNLPENSSLIFVDISGRVLWRNTASGKTTVIPAANLAAGMYLLQIKSETGNASYKLVKE
jgi:sugar lactone lactonase YvrE